MAPKHTIAATPAMDGAGVKINRIAGPTLHKLLDPYLMIDEIKSMQQQDYMAGFPSHPHRGFETISYLLQGRMRHEDHLGHQRVMSDGGVQWMTTGHGIIHSEMPEPTDGLFHGFQIWLNLPSEHKLMAPAYHDLATESLTTFALSGGSLKMITGEISADQQVLTSNFSTDIRTRPTIADLRLDAGHSIDLSTAAGSTLLVYVYDGAENHIPQGHLGVYEQANASLVAKLDMRALILSGQPLNEPVVQYGPFVMNTHQQIEQAMRDYANNSLAT